MKKTLTQLQATRGDLERTVKQLRAGRDKRRDSLQAIAKMDPKRFTDVVRDEQAATVRRATRAELEPVARSALRQADEVLSYAGEYGREGYLARARYSDPLEPVQTAMPDEAKRLLNGERDWQAHQDAAATRNLLRELLEETKRSRVASELARLPREGLLERMRAAVASGNGAELVQIQQENSLRVARDAKESISGELMQAIDQFPLPPEEQEAAELVAAIGEHRKAVDSALREIMSGTAGMTDMESVVREYGPEAFEQMVAMESDRDYVDRSDKDEAIARLGAEGYEQLLMAERRKRPDREREIQKQAAQFEKHALKHANGGNGQDQDGEALFLGSDLARQLAGQEG